MEEEEQEQVYNFEGSDGQKYAAKKSELPELVAAAKREGVVLKGVMSKEESTAARDDDYWTWDNAKAGVRGIWDDPTGEHGALAYMGLNVAKGIATAAGWAARGITKGAADVGFGLARGVTRGVESLVGADGHAVSGFLGDWHDSFNEIVDAITPGDQFEKYGMYDGIEGAHETMGMINQLAETAFEMKGMGLAAKGVGALAGGRNAAAIGQAAMAAGMGGKGYAEMAEDPLGPGGWRQELAAAAKGAIEALTFNVMAPFKKMNMALPKPFEQLTKMEIAKRFAWETFKSGGMMALVEAEKEGLEALATAGTDERWHPKTFGEILKGVGSQFIVGSGLHTIGAMGKTGAYMKWRADRKAREGALTFQVEQNRKTYAPIMDRQARLALQAREVAARDPGAKWLEASTPGAEGTENVKAVAKDGSVQFDDGSVWRMGADGRATITVADGTILDARTGAVEGYRANREADVQRDAEGNELPKEETRAENAALFLDALERGELPTVAQPLEGLQITETSYKKGTVLDGEWDQAKAPPVVVWVGDDGTRVLMTGRSRAEGAAAAGAKEIKAVEIHERDWTRQQAESLDAVENMREGRGTREEIARGVEALGIRSEEDCDRYGIVPERPVVDAITVLNEGSEALKSAASEGTVGRAWAAACAEKLGKKSLGEASERAQATALDMIAGKLPPEEATAAMDAIAELAARKPDYTDREAAEAIRAARERAVGRVAVDADSEMVEMPDGTIKSVAEAKAEGAAQAQEAAAEGKTVDESGWLPKAPAAPGADKAAEPTVKADGSVGCVRFEGAKATRTRSEDGREIVLIEGMTGEEMMRPENRDAAVQFITRLKEMAGDVDLVFADVSAADAAEALLMAARVRARVEARSVSGDTIAGSGDLVAAGQRLVDGLFGERSGIRVRTGTREEAEAELRAAGETKPIKDAEGQVQGYYHRGKGEVVLFEGADAGTLAHEIGWHAVWHWAERNSPDLLLKMKRYAARAPLELKAQIKEVYGDFKGDALMDEIGAGRFERAMGERFQKLLAKSPEVRSWWRKVLHALARAWKGMARTVGGNRIDLKKIEKMDPEEAIEALTAQMLEGRRLGEGGGPGKGIRPSIGGIYTGTAADYANRSRQGGVDDGPSVKKIGTGEGSQVYGWGLYGSSVRGVADRYAKNGRGAGGKDWIKEGRNHDELSDVEKEAASYLKGMGSKKAAIERLKEDIEWFEKQGIKDEAEALKPIVEELSAHGDEYREQHENVYEQTFFTNRAPGDESHLLKWYEDLPKEQVDWIAQEFAKEGFFVASFSKLKGWTILDRTSGKKMSLWDKRESGETYEAIAKFLGSPQAASEFLARAGIDGVKYPVDSYGGKGVKDGDVAGWNYVSFRDDNIRVDHKWTDGQIRYSRKQMNALAKSKVGEWVEGTSADGLRNAIEKRIEEGLPEGEYRFKNAEDRSRLVRGAVKFYKRFAQKTVMLSDGRCVYFVPDARARERGLTNEEAWAEYAIHAVTSSGRPLEGKGYSERLYNATKAQNIWRIENILKAERCEVQEAKTDRSAGIAFYGKGVDGKVIRIITRLDEANNIYADLSEVTVVNANKIKRLPPRKPLAEVVGAAQYRGGLPTGDAESISQQGGGAQEEIRPSIRNRGERRVTPEEEAAYEEAVRFNDMHVDLRYSRRGGKRRDEVYDDVLRAVRAGGQRVAAGRSERTDAGFDAGAALWMEREGQLGKSPDGSMTLSYSEALRLYRAMSASAHMPKVLEKMPHLATRDRKGRLRLNAAAFGIVDKSDLEAVKAGLKKDGMFLHEDPSWRLHNDFEEVRAMKEMSEQALAEEMEKLAEARITGKMSGGGRTAVNILAKEIGRIACELPVTAGAPQSLKDLRKLGRGIAKELGDPKGELGKEAREAARWWREQDPVRKDPTATKSEDIAESELWAEMFGMFLADPMALQDRAPNVYGKMVEAIAGNEKLSEAWNGLRRTRDAEGPHERVMRDIERQWTVEEQRKYKELEAELDKPIGTWGKRTKARLLLELHGMESPAVYWVTDAVRERLAELKRLKKAGKISDIKYQLLAGMAKDEIHKINAALLVKQRGGGTGRKYAIEFVERIMGEVEKDGMDWDDLRRYMYAKSVRDGLHQKGKAAALGMDQREAQKVLEDLERRLGADGWAKLERAAKRFQALREQNILRNEFVVEAFGKQLVEYWRMNASYVRSERTWTAEEVAAYEEARKDWMKRHPGESTVIAEIEALMDMHVAKGSGTAGSAFLKPLAGSLKAVKDPIAATLENDLRIIEFAQRNHWTCQLAESARTLELEGFAVMEDRGGGGRLRGSNRYGSVSFLKDGKRMTLVMPKVVAEGFEYAPKSVNMLVKINRGLSAILTQYSPRFALRNIWRNRASNANNIAWMGEGRFVTAAGLVGMRPVARLATFLLERAAAHLPDRFARNAFMNLLYGPTTNIYWEGEATRLAKMMHDPFAMRERIERAERLANQGKTAEAQRIWEDVEKAKALMGKPVFAGIRENMWGEADKTDLDAVFRSMGMDTNFDGKKLTGMQRVKREMKEAADKVKRFNDFEEARVKAIAFLAAEHEAMRIEQKGEIWAKSHDEITYQVATMSGSPRYENRGRVMNYVENALGPFMNVGMKGAWRTLEAMRYDPKRWWTKAAGRIAGRVATYVLWMGGGYKVIANWLRGEAGDDEERNKLVDAFERFGKRMAHALANVSDYRLRNYDIVPVGLYGKWSTLAISMPRGDEEKLLTPAVDLLVHGMLGSEKAQEMGFALPTDLNYTASEAVQNTVFGSGLIPDPLRRGLLWTVAQDAIMPWFGYNPYNSFTQRDVYNQADVDAAWEEPWNMAKKVAKQVWNDLGGQVVMPATTWDEDEGAYDDQGKWALSGAEEGEAGCMPIGGKTIFQALHSIPFLSSAASGLITFQNGGNERIARRLEKYRRDDSAPLRAAAQRVADEVIEARRKYGEDFDYSEMLEARVSELELPEEDKEIIQGLAFSKCQRILEKMGMEFDPIGEALRKMSNDEKMYRRAKRQVEAEGWDGDFD